MDRSTGISSSVTTCPLRNLGPLLTPGMICVMSWQSTCPAASSVLISFKLIRLLIILKYKKTLPLSKKSRVKERGSLSPYSSLCLLSFSNTEGIPVSRYTLLEQMVPGPTAIETSVGKKARRVLFLKSSLKFYVHIV